MIADRIGSLVIVCFICSIFRRMVLLINGVPLEEAPRDITSFFQQFPHFKEQASSICSTKTQAVGPVGLLYVFQREFAVTHPHDNKISILGTDDVTTGHILIIRHTGKPTSVLIGNATMSI